MIVHLLHEGFTLCGFGRGQFPGEWNGGHRWTYINDAENATCEACLKALREREKKTPAQALADDIIDLITEHCACPEPCPVHDHHGRK